jgi:hypothetical protein
MPSGCAHVPPVASRCSAGDPHVQLTHRSRRPRVLRHRRKASAVAAGTEQGRKRLKSLKTGAGLAEARQGSSGTAPLVLGSPRRGRSQGRSSRSPGLSSPAFGSYGRNHKSAQLSEKPQSRSRWRGPAGDSLLRRPRSELPATRASRRTRRSSRNVLPNCWPAAAPPGAGGAPRILGICAMGQPARALRRNRNEAQALENAQNGTRKGGAARLPERPLTSRRDRRASAPALSASGC